MMRQEIESGAGILIEGRTLIWQRGSEDVFDTSDKSAAPRPGWHLAGGAERLVDGTPKIEWCDLR